MRMRINRLGRSEGGLAAVEFALILPVLTALLFLLLEGGYAIKTYATLLEASREGARLVLRDGEAADVQALVRSLTRDMAGEDIASTVTADPVNRTVTVEVSYEYRSFCGENSYFQTLNGESDPYVFKAQTTMPLP